MKVYVSYFRYDRNENYSIYDVSLDRDKSIKKYQDELLPDFLGYGPDDVSYLILKEVELTKSDYDELIRLSKIDEDYVREVIEFMTTKVHEEDGEEIFYVSGDLNWDILDFFMTSGLYDLDDLLGVDTSTLDEDELSEQCQERLWYDDEDNIFNSVLKDFLNN
jgi:hypothetical protein